MKRKLLKDYPETKTLHPSALFVLIVVAVIVFFLEIFLFSYVSLKTKIVIHVAAVGLCLLVSAISYVKKLDARLALFLTLFTTCLGPLGTLVGLMMILLYPFYRRSSTRLGELLDTLMPESSPDEVAVLHDRIKYGLDQYDPDSKLYPFMDIICYGTVQQKKLAIEKILRYFRPEFSPVLKKALQDPESGVRVLAATAINAIDSLYFKKYLEMEAVVKESSNKIDLLNYARHCEQYAMTEVLDAERDKKMMVEAIRAYEEYLEENIDDLKSMGSLGKLYVLTGNNSKARLLLESVFRTYSTIPFEVYKWYLCALYNSREYDFLRQFAATLYDKFENKKGLEEIRNILKLYKDPCLPQIA